MKFGPKFWLLAILVVLLVWAGSGLVRWWLKPKPDLVVGSKEFTEGITLGEIAHLAAEQAGYRVEHKQALGGTRLVWEALLRGEIDVYPEYTGTLTGELLAEENIQTVEEIRAALQKRGILMSSSLGFENSYAMGMKRDRAAELGIEKLSDLRNHPNLQFGVTDSFRDREDGWKKVRAIYNLPHTGKKVRAMKHELAYQQLEQGIVDVVDFYTTDAEIAYYDLKVLADDLNAFTDYEAYLIYREEVTDMAPKAVEAWERLAGDLTEERMRTFNKMVVIDEVSSSQVAANYLGLEIAEETLFDRLLRTTQEHLNLVALSMVAGIVLAIPLGYLSAKIPTLGQAILAIVGIIQTIPSLALLVFMLPVTAFTVQMVFGNDPQIDRIFWTAVVALFLYSLLPMVRSTHIGMTSISVPVQESAEALGLSYWAKMWKIELPLASPSILAGIKTSTIIIIGFATLGGLIGAGGYGQPILAGIRLNDTYRILEGALPAALLAIIAQLAFDGLERAIVPKGLRLKRSG